jgi:hypothetical protein
LDEKKAGMSLSRRHDLKGGFPMPSMILGCFKHDPHGIHRFMAGLAHWTLATSLIGVSPIWGVKWFAEIDDRSQFARVSGFAAAFFVRFAVKLQGLGLLMLISVDVPF